MNIIDRLNHKIEQSIDSQEKEMYENIRTNLLVACDSVRRKTINRMCNLIDAINFDVEYNVTSLKDEYRRIIFYTKSFIGERINLLQFDLYYTHYLFQFLFF